MATTTVTYSPAAGRQFVDLTSWAGDASFATTPVAGDQIEAVDTLTLNSDGSVSGSDGSYTLRHIRAANGTVEAVSYSLVNPDVTAPTISTLSATGTDPDTIDVSVSTDEDNGTLYVFASANASETAAAIKTGAQGSQAVSATGTQTLALTLSTGNYYVHVMHEDAAGNQSNVLSSAQITLAAIVETASTTVTYQVPADKTLVTLVAGAINTDPYLTDDFLSPPEAGEQAITTTSEGVFTENFYWVDEDGADGVYTYWYVNNAGVLYAREIDTTGLESAVDTTPDQFSLGADVTDAEPGATTQRTFVVAGIEAGETVSVTATGDATATPSTAENGDTITVELTAGTFEAVVSGGVSIGGVSDSFSVTTRAAVLPTQDVALPDLDLGQGDEVSIDLDSYFSGATSYSVSGLPAGSGLSLSGSTISGTTNTADIDASPYTVTVTAASADGSIQDAFSVAASAPAPVIGFSAPLTTTDTSPVVSGFAGTATSITLLVNGETYTQTVTDGAWSQQLPTLGLGPHPMTLNGEDAEGAAADEVQATLLIIEAITNAATGRLQPFSFSNAIGF